LAARSLPACEHPANPHPQIMRRGMDAICHPRICEAVIDIAHSQTFETGRFQGEGNDRRPGSLALRSYRGPPRGSPKSDGLSAPPALRPSLLCRTQKKSPHRNGQGSAGAGLGPSLGGINAPPNLSKSAAEVWSKKLTPHVPHSVSRRFGPSKTWPLEDLASRKWETGGVRRKLLSGLCHPDYSR
jgi:hypothetical protein